MMLAGYTMQLRIIFDFFFVEQTQLHSRMAYYTMNPITGEPEFYIGFTMSGLLLMINSPKFQCKITVVTFLLLLISLGRERGEEMTAEVNERTFAKQTNRSLAHGSPTHLCAIYRFMTMLALGKIAVNTLTCNLPCCTKSCPGMEGRK